jgi:hypothetical protein
VAVDGVGHCAGAPLHRWAAAVARAGLATPLLSLEANFDYSRAAPHLEAASFVGFIRDRYGIAALRMIWEHGLAAAERATGTPVAAVEAAWRAEVSRHGGPESAGLDPRGRVSCE